MSIFRVTKKFKRILSIHQQFRIAQLFVLMIIGGSMEMLSVSLIFPFMNIVMNPEQTMSSHYVLLICEILDLHSPKAFLIILAIFLAIIYILKNLFLLFEYNMQYRFVCNNMLDLKNQLMESYLSRPYEYFLYSDTSVIIRIIHEDTNAVFGLLMNLLGLYTEIFVSVFLIIATIMTAPMITMLIACILLFLMLCIAKLLKPKLRFLGNEIRNSRSGMHKWLLQTLEGIKEVKVMQKEDFFRRSFYNYGRVNITNTRKHRILSIVPRFSIEAISMSSMFLIVAVMIYQGTDLLILVPMLSTVAMAAIRLLPSVNRISVSIGDVAYNELTLDKLIENLEKTQGKEDRFLAKFEINESQEKSKVIGELKKNVILENVSYHYPSNKKMILDNASMVINKGQSIGIVGLSGAGKTTALDIILGLLTPYAGHVKVDGTDIHDDYQGWLSQIGYIPQTIFLIDGTVKENIAFGLSEKEIDEEQVWKALEDASLKEYIKEQPEGLDSKIGERGIRLSGGQRQRIGIARALYKNPSILFFDEATSALDNDTEKSIMTSIHNLKGEKTIIIIAHRLSTIEDCDVIYRVENGKIRKSS